MFVSFPCHPPFFLLFGSPLTCLSPFFHVSPRTESVAEKMLTNWFTFLLYKFLKVKLLIAHTQAHTTFEATPIQLVVEEEKCLPNTHTHTHTFTAAALDKREAAGYLSLTSVFHVLNSPFSDLRNLQSLKPCSDGAGHVVVIAAACCTNLSSLCVPGWILLEPRKCVHVRVCVFLLLVCILVCLYPPSELWGA